MLAGDRDVNVHKHIFAGEPSRVGDQEVFRNRAPLAVVGRNHDRFLVTDAGLHGIDELGFVHPILTAEDLRHLLQRIDSFKRVEKDGQVGVNAPDKSFRDVVPLPGGVVARGVVVREDDIVPIA